MRIRFVASLVVVCLCVWGISEIVAQVAPPAAGARAGKKKRKKQALRQQNGIVPAPPAPAEAPPVTTSTESLAPAESSGEGDMQPQAGGPRRAGRRANKVNSEPPAPLYDVNSIKLTNGSDYDSQPSVTQLPNGDTYLAWVRYSPAKLDEVAVMLVRGGIPRQRLVNWKVVSGKPGQFIRPVIAAAGEDILCFWTQTNESQLAAIWYAKLSGGAWSDPARLLPNLKLAHQNPEVSASSDGKLAVAYQVNNGNSTGYDVECTTLSGGAWSEPVNVSNSPNDDWDPTLVYDKAGNLHIAWSAFDHGDYDVYESHAAATGGFSAPRRISARGDYDMHPWLAAAPDGAVWLSWDAVQIGRHGYSGRMTITGANLKDDPTSGPAPEHGERAKYSGIEVRVLDGDTVRIPGNPREEITPTAGFKFSHRALGKISISSDGVPWVIYRALTQPAPAWDGPGSNAGYYWQLQARAFRNGHWQPPVNFLESDGYLEEAGVYPSAEGVRVAYTSEHRRSTTSNIDYLTKKPGATPTTTGTSATIEEMYDHHHDFDNFLGWDGDIYMATLGRTQEATDAIAAAGLPAEEKPRDGPVDIRLTRETGRHAVQANGETYQLYWGDTHRHSNVSRCSVGTEPSPDDLYRYGIDINLYDFVALSDHAEHTTDFYWWKQQKTADLYNIPGILSVLYNYEWSMGFPEGHHNAIFATRNDIKMNGKIGAAKTMVGGWELLAAGGYKAITAPHTTADPGMGTNWNANDERFQRVCEIFQACRGSYEYDGCPRQHTNAKNKAGFYWKGLAKGYHLGIICSSDHGYGCAYACTYATTNTREATWQSIWDRRCYGSTTYGLVADVRSGNHWMGEQWDSAEAPPISIYVRGSAPIRSVEIMGRFKTLHADGSVEHPLNVNEYKLDWTDPEWSTLAGEQWYYVRIIQTDDEMAWTSPMWVKKP